MKQFLNFILVVALLISCNGGENDIESDKEVEVFTSSAFKRYGPELGVWDFLIDEDGYLVLTGTGQKNGFLVQPFVAAFDIQKEISWLEFLNVDYLNLYRAVRIIPNQAGNYIVLTYSDPENKPEFVIDITEISQSGVRVWNQQIEEPGKRFREGAIIQLPDQDYIILNEIEGQNLLFHEQFALIRIAENGELRWLKTIDEEEMVGANQMIYLPADNSLIMLSMHTDFGFQTGKAKIHKFDIDGDIIWQKSIDFQGKLSAASGKLSQIDHEAFVVTFSSTDSPASNDIDIIAIKMDKDGNEQWKRTYGGNGTDLSESWIQTNDGKYVLLSTTSSYGSGDFDVMISKIDVNGTPVWNKVYGGSFSDQAVKIIERSNGNLVVVGNTNDGNSSPANFDMFVLETDHEGNPE